MADKVEYKTGVLVTYDDGYTMYTSDEDKVDEFLAFDGRTLPNTAEFAQQKAVKQNLKGLFTGLRQLDPEDAAYAAYGRSWAVKNGESQEVILAIVDRQTAGNYITAQTEWQNLPAASKQFFVDHIDAMMKIIQGILIAFS